MSGGGTTTGGRVGGVDAQSRGYEQNSGVGRLGSGSGSGSGGIGQGAGVGAATRDYANVAPNAADAHSVSFDTSARVHEMKLEYQPVLG